MMEQLPDQQNALFYEFCLEDHIPEDHLLRQINQFLDFNQIRDHIQSYYSHTGRPSIDRVEKSLDMKPERLMADTAYGSAAMLDWVVAQKQIEPHIPVWEKSTD
ncbi:MAG: hypothetical protein GY746_16020, partial [Gammaproteobacteria bacterium]|nr:hypothetical protein [Gammaproteobacteria bacterium]